MEKCGKVLRQKRQSAARRDVRGEVYSETIAGEKVEMRACSACAGDYEDPDRTAWTPDDAADPEFDGAPSATPEKFPAEE